MNWISGSVAPIQWLCNLSQWEVSMDDNQQSYNRQPSVVSYNQIVKKLLETVMTVSVLNVRNEVWRIRYAFSILIDQMWIFVKKIFLNYALELFLLGRTSKKQKQWIQKGSNLHFLHPPSLSLSHTLKTKWSSWFWTLLIILA